MKKLFNANEATYTMVKALIVTGLILASNHLIAYAANSQWYWVSVPTSPMTGYFIEEVLPNTIGYTTPDTDPYGNKTIVPEGFMDTMDETEDSSKCIDELDSAILQLRNFDSVEKIMPTEKDCRFECDPYYTQEIIKKRESLLLNLMSEAKQCLAKEQREIQKVEEEQKQKEAEARRQKDITEAVESCDFDYFENEMSDNERMETYNERLACKESKSSPVPIFVPPDVYTDVIYTEPIIPAAPSQTPDIVNNPLEDTNIGQAIKPSITLDTTEQVREVSSNGYEEQQANVVTENPEPEPKNQSFFKRIVDFIFGWW